MNIRSMRLFFAVAAMLLPLQATAQGRALPDFTDLVERQSQTVVNISTSQAPRDRRDLPQLPNLDENDPFYDFFRRFIPRVPGQGPRGSESRSLGSGFIVSADGYILTNAHVIENAEEIIVRLTDKREFKATVVGSDRRTDVALIKIVAAGLPNVRIGDPSKLRVGEWVLAIGSPFGFDSSVTAGIVSAKGRSLPTENFVPFIQTDVAINPGNSGGPLFNMRGEVIGINSQIYSRTGGYMGVSFAIPIDVVMEVQSQLRQSGRVARGRIGVAIQEVSKELAESFALARASGALVNAVEKGGAADKAGVETGDIIMKFDGKAINASSDLPRLVGSTRPGTKVTMELWRKGASMEVQVTVGEIPEERVAGRERGRTRPEERSANRLGFIAAELSAEQRRIAKIAVGVVVEEVRPQLRADIRVGDIIVAVTAKGQSTEIKSADQLSQLLAQAEHNTTITLQLRRGEATLFVSARFEDSRG